MALFVSSNRQINEIHKESLAKGLDWRGVLDILGISFKVRKTGVLTTHCVVHRERTPSLHFWNTSGRCHCHGCGFDCDIFDFVANALDSSDPEIVRLFVAGHITTQFFVNDFLQLNFLSKLFDD
jgi:DNA primase